MRPPGAGRGTRRGCAPPRRGARGAPRPRPSTRGAPGRRAALRAPRAAPRRCRAADRRRAPRRAASRSRAFSSCSPPPTWVSGTSSAGRPARASSARVMRAGAAHHEVGPGVAAGHVALEGDDARAMTRLARRRRRRARDPSRPSGAPTRSASAASCGSIARTASLIWRAPWLPAEHEDVVGKARRVRRGGAPRNASTSSRRSGRPVTRTRASAALPVRLRPAASNSTKMRRAKRARARFAAPGTRVGLDEGERAPQQHRRRGWRAPPRSRPPRARRRRRSDAARAPRAACSRRARPAAPARASGPRPITGCTGSAISSKPASGTRRVSMPRRAPRKRHVSPAACAAWPRARAGVTWPPLPPPAMAQRSGARRAGAALTRAPRAAWPCRSPPGCRAPRAGRCRAAHRVRGRTRGSTSGRRRAAAA